jgi:hypothetical protein
LDTHEYNSTPPSHRIVGAPVLIQGRLHWLTWDGYLLRLYRTLNPLSVNTTFTNNISFEARVVMPEPTHQTVLIGDRWYLLTRTGEIVFFLLSQAQGGTTLAAQPLDLPSGVVPDSNLPLVNYADNLCFVDRQNRVWSFSPATGLFTSLTTFSNQPITCLTVLNGDFLAAGRADGRVDIYNGVVPVLVGLRAPGAGNQPVNFVQIHEGWLTLAVGDTLCRVQYAHGEVALGARAGQRDCCVPCAGYAHEGRLLRAHRRRLALRFYHRARGDAAAVSQTPVRHMGRPRRAELASHAPTERFPTSTYRRSWRTIPCARCSSLRTTR